MAYQQINLENGILYIGELSDISVADMPIPFAVLLPAYSQEECIEAEKHTPQLLNMGCTEFCCVGKEARNLENRIDDIIVSNPAFKDKPVILTVSDVDDAEACAYFLLCAGMDDESGGTRHLLALVSGHPNLMNSLQTAIET